jgi:hypothetical protein
MMDSETVPPEDHVLPETGTTGAETTGTIAEGAIARVQRVAVQTTVGGAADRRNVQVVRSTKGNGAKPAPFRIRHPSTFGWNSFQNPMVPIAS